MKLPQGVVELAISQAKKSPMVHKHGAVVWKTKRILGAGYNYHNTPPSDSTRRFSIHSERDALFGLAASQINNSSMLAIRVNSSGELISCKPCKGCYKLLKRKGVKKVYWHDDQLNLNCTFLN